MEGFQTTDFLAPVALVFWFFLQQPRAVHPSGYSRRFDDPPARHRRAAKPEWVKQEIIRLKALQPEDGCRKLADAFNRLFAARGMSVGKTYVSDVIRKHQYEIRAFRRQVRNRKLRPGRKNFFWGLDLTGKTDEHGEQHAILGLVDHGSRACLELKALSDKRSITMLICLLKAVERFGRPRFVRTDNETIFGSWLFRGTLALLGIRHQRTDVHCPWQNGRVERLFGTLKQKLDRWIVPDGAGLQASLAEFRTWYNFIRPHQHLQGRTPAEVWNGTDVFTRQNREVLWFDAWDGLLTGLYLPP